MGYETKLIVGKQASHASQEWQEGELSIENGRPIYPILKDEEGKTLYTGRKNTWFYIYAEIDLCKLGSGSKIYSLDWVNKDENHFWYWFGYDGDLEISEDCYGNKPKPIPVKKVLDALRGDAKNEDYRRLKWAIALLESMENDKEELEVLIYGH